MIEPLSLLTAFSLGLLGASHCLVMCGGIAGAASMSAQGKRRLSYLLLFNLGRITSYACAGAMVSLLGLWLSDSHQLAQLVLRAIAGLLLMLMGLYVARWWMALTRLEALGNRLWRYLQPLAKTLLPIQSPSQALRLGLLWGWLPCGLIYSTLSWVAASADPVMGAMTMISFGLGTLPGVLAVGLFAQQLSQLLQHIRFRQGAGLLLMGYGGWSLAALW